MKDERFIFCFITDILYNLWKNCHIFLNYKQVYNKKLFQSISFNVKICKMNRQTLCDQIIE